MQSPQKKNCFNRGSPTCPPHCALPTWKYLGKSNKTPNPCVKDLVALPGVVKKRGKFTFDYKEISRLSQSQRKNLIRKGKECIVLRQNDMGCYSSLLDKSLRDIAYLKKNMEPGEFKKLDSAMWLVIKDSKPLEGNKRRLYEKYREYESSFAVFFEKTTHQFVITFLEKWLNFIQLRRTSPRRRRNRSRSRSTTRSRSRSRRRRSRSGKWRRGRSRSRSRRRSRSRAGKWRRGRSVSKKSMVYW